jgi:Uma2 family endonuclease
MSIDLTSDPRMAPGVPGGVRFRPRDEPPEPLFGPPNVNYPGHDGRPMADNTIQERWIFRIRGGLAALYRDDPNVFVASNLMWYPVKGVNRRRLAPDAMVVFGRPKGDRTSYVVHKEKGIGPQVVFEILSPGNRKRAMDYKRKVYETYGVEEYYVFDPYKVALEVWIREDDAFRLIPEASGWVSPRLRIRFELGDDLTIYAPDGRPFLDYAEVARLRDESERQSKEDRRAAARERRRAEAERQRAEALERANADERQKSEAERQRAESEHQRAERLAARLRELGIDPEE